MRYTQPPEPSESKSRGSSYSPPPALTGADAEPAVRSSRPGQSGFAHRLMSKYGWTQGTGLGAGETGIVNPLRVQVEKRRRKADADGGGWAEPANKGKIVGEAKAKGDGGKFGTMSEVIVLRHMLDSMPDLQAEIADGLGQEIGEECGEKVSTNVSLKHLGVANGEQYGRVERLYIDQENRQVFIKFTAQISALRVSALQLVIKPPRIYMLTVR